ncbi:MAG: DUF86 domain-containing protein [Schwartzia sp.]|nr:DUF86 domain-containing protein [Schwartzia sp. (in: firmicutes)]
MTGTDKDYQRLTHILTYCEKIRIAAEAFNNDHETFLDDANYQARDVCSFYILQIGELARGLTDEFKEKYNHIPWRQIRGMRNVVVHKYGEIDLDTLWDALTSDIPALSEHCRKIMEEYGSKNERRNLP